MKQTRVNDRWTLTVPDAIADWDAPAKWEVKRLQSMEDFLKPGNVVFDIGTEHGWLAAIVAGFVGAENMVLVEPMPDLWPNIRLTWEANDLPKPAYMAQMFAGGIPRGKPTGSTDWPKAAQGKETGATSYLYLHEPKHLKGVSTTTVDALSKLHPPDALNIDVEGAEFRVLKGAKRTLRNHRPLVWLSVHPDLLLEHYDTTPEEIWAYMGDMDYHRDLLEVDHEEHYLFQPKERL